MPKQKRDYSELKLEFFQSDIDELKAFLREKWVNYTSWGVAKMTRWRTKEKQEYKAKILEKALEKQATKDSNDLLIPVSFLMKAKKNAIIQIAKKLSEEWISINDLAKWLEAVKTELWEPSKITQNQNLNKEISDELSPDEQEALDIIEFSCIFCLILFNNFFVTVAS